MPFAPERGAELKWMEMKVASPRCEFAIATRWPRETKIVAVAGHDHAIAGGLQDALESLRYIQGQALLADALIRHAAAIMASVAGIDDNRACLCLRLRGADRQNSAKPERRAAPGRIELIRNIARRSISWEQKVGARRVSRRGFERTALEHRACRLGRRPLRRTPVAGEAASWFP